MKATMSTVQSIPNGTATTVTQWTTVYDSSSSFNAVTGIFTIPATGVYRITANMSTDSTTFTAGSLKYWQSKVGGSQSGTIQTETIQAAFTGVLSSAGSQSFQYTLGDTVDIRITQTTGSAVTLLASPEDTWLTIERTA
jgi:hypothetical protein